MGYYDDEGNYHSSRRAPENQLNLKGPQVLPRLTTSEQASRHDGEETSETPEFHGKGIRIRDRLAAMDEFLQVQKFDSRPYGKAPLLDSDAVRGLLKENKLATSTAMRTAQAAESLYGFFAPPDFAGPVLKKYWGAVHSLIQNLQSYSQEDTSSVQRFCDQLIDLAMRIKPIKLRFSRIGLVNPPTDKSSHPLERAWMHLLMSLIYVKQKPRRSA
ncbi:hypothetical protein BJX76DRAFT_229119 [Aspergillus varians]